jgi:hypothetical protein
VKYIYFFLARRVSRYAGMDVTLTLNMSNSLHISMSPKFLYKSCSIAAPKHSNPLPPENYPCIIALAPGLWNVSVYSKIEFLPHSSTIELLSLLILIKRSYPSFRTLLLWLAIVISLMAAVACRFMQDRYTGWYLRSKRVTIFGYLKGFAFFLIASPLTPQESAFPLSYPRPLHIHDNNLRSILYKSFSKRFKCTRKETS